MFASVIAYTIVVRGKTIQVADIIEEESSSEARETVTTSAVQALFAQSVTDLALFCSTISKVSAGTSRSTCG